MADERPEPADSSAPADGDRPPVLDYAPAAPSTAPGAWADAFFCCLGMLLGLAILLLGAGHVWRARHETYAADAANRMRVAWPLILIGLVIGCACGRWFWQALRRLKTGR